MSPPSPEQQDAALAALTGCVTEAKPETALDASLMRLRMIAEAKSAGIPWTAIGRVYGMSGKEAKAMAKRLAARTQRYYVLSLGTEVAPVPVPRSAAEAAVRRLHEREGVTLVPAKPRRPPARKHPHHVRRRGR